MICLAAVLSRRTDARGGPERALAPHGPLETVDEGAFRAAWVRADAVATARFDATVCVVAGAPVAEGQTDVPAVLAAAYARGGLDLAQLRGGFVVLLWDSRRGRGVAATDQLGVLSPVFRRVGGDLHLALEPRDLLALLPTRPPPDETSVVRWLVSGSLAADATLFAGVERLPGGHLLELGEGTIGRHRYWSLDHARPTAGLDGAEAEVKAALERAVEARLDDAAGVLLSGGLDSAAVAATAAGLRGRPGLPAYSLVFPQHPDVDERFLIETVASALRLSSHTVPVPGAKLLPAGVSYTRTWQVPPASPTLGIQLPLLQRAAADGTPTLLDGQGGDELFAASLHLIADRLRSGRLRDAHGLATRIPRIPDVVRARATRRALYEFGLKGALPYNAHAVARRLPGRRERWVPPWLTGRSAERYLAASDPWSWKRRPGPRWWAALVDSVTEQRERAGAHDYLRRRNALAGVQGGHPLLQDLDLIELVLRLPPELAFDPVLDRPLLRRAVASVPEAVRQRSTKSYFTPVFVEAMAVHDAEAARRLLTAPGAAINEYTQPELVRELVLDAPGDRRGDGWAWSLWRLAMLECWLRLD